MHGLSKEKKMTDSPERQPEERKPLMNKLEPTHTSNRQTWHNEAKAWSKTGRDFFQIAIDFLKELFT